MGFKHITPAMARNRKENGNCDELGAVYLAKEVAQIPDPFTGNKQPKDHETKRLPKNIERVHTAIHFDLYLFKLILWGPNTMKFTLNPREKRKNTRKTVKEIGLQGGSCRTRELESRL